MFDKKAIEEIIEYKFKSKTFLVNALTHTSYAKSHNNSHFERLEFLGDRVLGLVISDLLYEKFPSETEGDLAKRISVLVSGKTLQSISKDLKLKKYIKVGTNIDLRKSNNSILIDTMEALIGANFLDGGYTKSKIFILKNWQKYIVNNSTPPKDPKSWLQEWSVANNYGMPVYSNYSKTGPDHSPKFKVQLIVENYAKLKGVGLSKKEAERNAAKKIISLINMINK